MMDALRPFSFTWLYLEDNEEDATLVQAILGYERPDIRLIVFSDADAALDVLRTGAPRNDVPDIVLMEVTSGNGDGPGVIRRIRQIPHCRTIPVVVFTAMESEVALSACYHAGATSVVQKTCGFETTTRNICSIADEFCNVAA